MSDDPITELERYRRKQDAAYGAAFGHLCVEYLMTLRPDNAPVDMAHIAQLHAWATIAASYITAPLREGNPNRPLHAPWCTCAGCRANPPPEAR